MESPGVTYLDDYDPDDVNVVMSGTVAWIRRPGDRVKKRWAVLLKDQTLRLYKSKESRRAETIVSVPLWSLELSSGWSYTKSSAVCGIRFRLHDVDAFSKEASVVHNMGVQSLELCKRWWKDLCRHGAHGTGNGVPTALRHVRSASKPKGSGRLSTHGYAVEPVSRRVPLQGDAPTMPGHEAMLAGMPQPNVRVYLYCPQCTLANSTKLTFCAKCGFCLRVIAWIVCPTCRAEGPRLVGCGWCGTPL